jgi:hypothetical protein
MIRQVGLGKFSALAITSDKIGAENVPMEGTWGLPWEFTRLPSYMNRQQNVGAIYYAQSAQKSSATPI